MISLQHSRTAQHAIILVNLTCGPGRVWVSLDLHGISSCQRSFKAVASLCSGRIAGTLRVSLC